MKSSDEPHQLRPSAEIATEKLEISGIERSFNGYLSEIVHLVPIVER